MTKKPLDPNLAAILDSIRATVGGAEPQPDRVGGVEPQSSQAGGELPAEAAAARAEEAVRAVPAALPEPRAAVRSVEEFLADLIRPQVQAWLDAHLPELVQQLTAAEIEKLIGRQ